jgi:cardiolipin synthase
MKIARTAPLLILSFGLNAFAGEPVLQPFRQDSTANRHTEVINLDELGHYPLLASGQPKNFFYTENQFVKNYSLELKSALPTLKASLHCDAPASVRTNAPLGLGGGRSGTDLRFDLYNTTENGKKYFLDLNPAMSECTLILENPETRERGGIAFKNISKHFAFLPALESYRETCVLPKASGDKLEQLFVSPDYTSMTCPQTVDGIKTLEAPEDGFNAKVAALLGQPVSHDFIQKADPFAPLDFSRAPKLDAVFVASLVYRSDFYGNVMARLLKYHADRGTLVYILVSDILQSKKDHLLLDTLARENGNIKVQNYRYNAPSKNPLSFDQINQLHRDFHIKIVATYSAAEPKNNVIITGGRNIHDGFLFLTKPDLSKYPQLTQWGTDENFVHWNDFEMQIQSPSFAKKIFAHLLTVWHMDGVSQDWDSINKNITDAAALSGSYLQDGKQIKIRHVISAPFKDDHALERLYVQMIDASMKTIKLSSPYLRPTDKISEALDRAIQRGVKVTIQTRIDLAGDTLDWLYTEMNKESINHFKDKVQLYEWTENSILHSKLLMIDGEYGLIGSVNVSRRSFVHDIESVFMIHGEDFIQHMEKIFDGYTAASRRVTEKQKRKAFPSALLKLLENEF